MEQGTMQGLPGYEVIEKLGESYVTEVWKAHQVSVKRDVCVKRLKAEFSADAFEVDRFLSEARNTSELNHPNIVTIYNVIEHEGTHHMVMEYVEGPTIDARLRKQQRLSVEEAFGVGIAVGQALAHAWERHSMIHRNITPKSIFLDGGETVKVGYVGLSLRVDPMNAENGPGDNVIEGTPYYMAPEQARGESLSIQTDMYGLGCSLYHMITGHMPFENVDAMTAIDKQVSARIRHPRNFAPKLGPAAALVMERLLMKQPADRYKSWADAIRAMEQVLSGKVVLVRKGRGGGGASTIAPYDPSSARAHRGRPKIRIVKKSRGNRR